MKDTCMPAIWERESESDRTEPFSKLRTWTLFLFFVEQGSFFKKKFGSQLNFCGFVIWKTKLTTTKNPNSNLSHLVWIPWIWTAYSVQRFTQLSWLHAVKDFEFFCSCRKFRKTWTPQNSKSLTTCQDRHLYLVIESKRTKVYYRQNFEFLWNFQSFWFLWVDGTSGMFD